MNPRERPRDNPKGATKGITPKDNQGMTPRDNQGMTPRDNQGMTPKDNQGWFSDSLQGGVAKGRVSRFCHKEVLLVTGLADSERNVIATMNLTTEIDVDSGEKPA